MWQRTTSAAAVAVVLASGVWSGVGPAAASTRAGSGPPRVVVESVSTAALPAVTVHYSVADMPRSGRVLLQRRVGPHGRLVVVDSALGSTGTLTDGTPSRRPAQYLLVVEGARGLVLATTSVR